MNFILKRYYLLAIMLLPSCVSYYHTDDGGVRVKNPKVFKYNTAKDRQKDKTGIDTNAIYVLDSSYNSCSTPNLSQSRKAFVRFFGTGQVLFVYCDSVPSLSEINNEDIGVPGYYIVQGTKVKIDMFQYLNGGQTGRYYGRIMDNGDLKFYEQRPETYFNSFILLEKAEGKERFSIWRKRKIENIKNYTPKW